MRYVGYFETSGSPVCISELERASKWHGIEGDYERLVEHLSTDIISFSKGQEGIDFLFFNTETGNFTVFTDSDKFLLAEIVYQPEDYSLSDASIDFAAHTSKEAVFEMQNFGGRILFFPSTFPGKEISLKNPGSGTTGMPDYPGAPPNTLVMDISEGSWRICAFTYESEDGQVKLDGAMFEKNA